MHSGKVRVFIERRHLASLDKELVLKFKSAFSVKSFVAWVQELATASFDIDLSTGCAVDSLRDAVRHTYSCEIGDWLTYSMLARLRENARQEAG